MDKYIENKHEHSGSHCGIYEESDFKRFLAGAMSEREIERLTAHCLSCDDCRDELENATLLQKTMALLSELDKGKRN